MFFQNPFAEEFRGSMPLGDRQYSLDFICPQNMGRQKDAVLSWAAEPYNFTTNSSKDVTGRALGTLNLAFSFGPNFNYWNTYTIDFTNGTTRLPGLTYVIGPQYTSQPNPSQVLNPPVKTKEILIGNSQVTLNQQTNIGTPSPSLPQVSTTTMTGSLSAAKAQDVVAVLNNDTNFSSYWTASVYVGTSGNQILIKQNQPVGRFKFYVVNGQAEEVLKFNDRAGVSELPEYFIRHCVGNYAPVYNPTASTNANYPDCTGSLILLTPGIYAVPTTTDPIQQNQNLTTQSNWALTASGMAAITAISTTATITSANHGIPNGTPWSIAVKKSDCYTTAAGVISLPTCTDGDSLTGTYSTANAFTITIASVSGPIYGTRGYWTTKTNFNIIANAKDNKGNILGLSFDNIREDFEILAGRAGTFNFTAVVLDPAATSAPRALYTIIWPAGAGIGYIAKKTTYIYDQAASGIPVETMETPHVLKAVDLIRPF